MTRAKSLTVSAPGKILFAGGYLVLESPNIGVVIGVDRRFYASISLGEQESSDQSGDVTSISVSSPQFSQSWKYYFHSGRKQLVVDESNGSKNEFVEKTLRVALLYVLLSVSGKPATINLSIQADNDFYSLVPHLEERGMELSLNNALSLPKFLPTAKDKLSEKILKSGLGSSACLVTSVVGALCYALGIQNEQTTFKLAQICHCYAQGKVGSGFDVSAACHGSHVYERFPKVLLTDFLTKIDSQDTSASDLQKMLVSIVDKKWEGGVVDSLRIAAHGPNSLLQVTMADVSGGSESPSMARAVLKWKSTFEKDSPVPHWSELVTINQNIAAVLQEISMHAELSDTDKRLLVQYLQNSSETNPQSHLVDTVKILRELKRLCLESRRHLRAIGTLAGVPVEPDEQTKLADATGQVPGVLAALVPGAGGYDALACMYLNLSEVRDNIGKFWCEWSHATVCPLTVQAVSFGEGLRIEK